MHPSIGQQRILVAATILSKTVFRQNPWVYNAKFLRPLPGLLTAPSAPPTSIVSIQKEKEK
jgi:hypothetical protein